MCSAQVLSCPLCCKPNFESVDALKISLVKVTNRPLVCPICNEMLFGLDKLTIHLFSHSLVMDVDENEDSNDVKREEERINNGMMNCKSPSNSIVTPQSPCSSTTPVPQVHCSPRSPTVVTQQRPRSTHLNSSPSCSSTSTSAASPLTSGSKVSQTLLPSIKCDICDFVFDNQKHLSMHMSLVHVVEPSAEANSPTKLPCHLCNKSFKMKGSLRVHLKVVHSHGFQNLCKDVAVASKNKDDDLKMSPRASSSNGKMQFNGDVETEEKGIFKGPIKAKEPTSPDQSKSWICDICSKSFTTKYFLKKHKRLHTGEMPYACTICGKTFTFQQSYHKHLLYHSDEKPHVCGTCGRAFKELSTLHNHERIHSGEKPFKCETCGKCFRQRVSYLVHRRIHDGTMPYKCTACAKSFRYKVSQRTHKCPAQPPGQVIRQSGELLQKLLLNSNLVKSPEEIQEDEDQKLDAEERHRINEMIDKSIEDMARGKVDHNISELFPTPIVEEILGIPQSNEGSMNSPSDQFQNLCLYSHDQLNDVLNEESIHELLYSGQM